MDLAGSPRILEARRASFNPRGIGPRPSPRSKGTGRPKNEGFASVSYIDLVKQLTNCCDDPTERGAKGRVSQVARMVTEFHEGKPAYAADHGLERWLVTPTFGLKSLMLLARWLHTKGCRLAP